MTRRECYRGRHRGRGRGRRFGRSTPDHRTGAYIVAQLVEQQPVDLEETVPFVVATVPASAVARAATAVMSASTQ